ncbi:hypothetical protein ACX93W_02870 [Paenibacillus sp. CAU 1782]
MVNKRSFLIGLGLGIIIGALLLELFYMGEASQRGLEGIGRELEQATQQPLATSSSSPELDSSNNDRQSDAGQATPEPSPQPEQADQETSAEKPDVAPESTDEQGGETAQSEASTPASQDPGHNESSSVIVRIPYASSLTEAAEMLAAAGVLESAESFANEMKSRNKVVRAGYFLFPPGVSSRDDVIEIITGIPLPPKEAEKLDNLLWRG